MESRRLPAGQVSYKHGITTQGGADMKKTGVFYHDVCGKEAYSSLAMGVEEGFLGIKNAGFFSRPNTCLSASGYYG